MTWAEFKSGVRRLLSDLEPNNDLFAQAVADYVKAKFSREVERNLSLHDSYWTTFKNNKRRLLGFEHTFANVAALKTKVIEFLPVDKNRLNTDAFLDAQIGIAVHELQQCKGLFDAWIRLGVIDIQRVADRMQIGHETEYTVDDVVPEGYASAGQLPEQALPQQAWIIYKTLADEKCTRVEIRTPTQWADRYLCLIDKATCEPRITYEPTTKAFYVTPQMEVTDDVEIMLRVTWNGLKLDFEDADVVPFPEMMQKCAADYVNFEAAREFGLGESDMRTYLASYKSNRRMLIVTTLEERRHNLR